MVGKVSLDAAALAENLSAFVRAVDAARPKGVKEPFIQARLPRPPPPPSFNLLRLPRRDCPDHVRLICLSRSP
jgi:hypothetical protein